RLRVDPSCGRRLALRLLDERRCPVPVVRACDDEMCSGELAGGLEQVLDALARCDAADVEDDRRVAGNAEACTEVTVRLGTERLREAVAAHTHLPGRNAPRDD